MAASLLRSVVLQPVGGGQLSVFRYFSIRYLRFKTIPQQFSTIETVSVVVTIKQQTIFCSDLLFLLNNLNIFPMNSNCFIQVGVKKKYFF